MLSFLSGIRDALSGYKTYVIALVVIIIGVVEGALGFDIPGVEVGPDWLQWVLNGIGLGTLRAGISKSGPTTLRSIALPLVLGLMLVAPVAVQAQACGQRGTIAEVLSGTYGETMRAVGQIDGKTVLEVWATPDGATWSLLVTKASGLSCILHAGTDWLQAPPDPPAGTPG